MIARSQIRLRDFAGEECWGEREGRELSFRLIEEVSKARPTTLFAISMGGVRRLDTAFARESLVELAHRFRTAHGFYLVDVGPAAGELRENVGAAAEERRQPLVDWTGGAPEILGPQPSAGKRDVLWLAFARSPVSTRLLVAELGLKSANASNKLIALHEEGYLVRERVVRETDFGRRGTEFEYYAVGPTRAPLAATA